MPTSRVAIVDDERLARELLRRAVDRHPSLEYIGQAASGEEAIELLSASEADILLLDVEMPERDGFGVLAELEARQVLLPAVIFVTAYDRYAVRAFEAQAVDYLLKPVTDERFVQAVERCLSRGDDRQAPRARDLAADALQAPPSRLLVRLAGRIIPVPVDSIDWIEASGDYVRIHVGERSHLIERSLTEMERLLESRSFLRIHRGALVNQARIGELRSLGSGRYQLKLEGGQELVVSRTYSKRFRGDLL